MKKKLLVFLMCLLVLTMAFCLVACNKQTNDTPATTPHTHTYAESWSSDADYHWHEATCEHSDAIEKVAHTWDTGVITTPQTETVEGIKTYTCTVCGKQKTENLGVLGHTHTFATEWSSDSDHHWYASTCGHDSAVQKATHTFGDVVVDTPATTVSKGSQHKTCTVCGYRVDEDIDQIVTTIQKNKLYDDGNFKSSPIGTTYKVKLALESGKTYFVYGRTTDFEYSISGNDSWKLESIGVKKLTVSKDGEYIITGTKKVDKNAAFLITVGDLIELSDAYYGDNEVNVGAQSFVATQFALNGETKIKLKSLDYTTTVLWDMNGNSYGFDSNGVTTSILPATTYYLVLNNVTNEAINMDSTIECCHSTLTYKGKCVNCEEVICNKELTYDDDSEDVTFTPYGDKIYFNFETIASEYFYLDIENQQQLENPIDETTPCLIESIKLYDANGEEINLLRDTDHNSYYYYWWESDDELEGDKKYYCVITLDSNYVDLEDDFVCYFSSITKIWETLEFTTNSFSKEYDGSSLNIQAQVKDAEPGIEYGVLEYLYKVKDEDDSTYTQIAPVDAGEYTLLVKLISDRYESDIEENFEITKKAVYITSDIHVTYNDSETYSVETGIGDIEINISCNNNVLPGTYNGIYNEYNDGSNEWTVSVSQDDNNYTLDLSSTGAFTLVIDKIELDVNGVVDVMYYNSVYGYTADNSKAIALTADMCSNEIDAASLSGLKLEIAYKPGGVETMIELGEHDVYGDNWVISFASESPYYTLNNYSSFKLIVYSEDISSSFPASKSTSIEVHETKIYKVIPTTTGIYGIWYGENSFYSEVLGEDALGVGNVFKYYRLEKDKTYYLSFTRFSGSSSINLPFPALTEATNVLSTGFTTDSMSAPNTNYYYFTCSQSGIYEISTSSGSSVTVLSGNNSFVNFCELESGKTYILKVHKTIDTGTVTVSFKKTYNKVTQEVGVLRTDSWPITVNDYFTFKFENLKENTTYEWMDGCGNLESSGNYYLAQIINDKGEVLVVNDDYDIDTGVTTKKAGTYYFIFANDHTSSTVYGPAFGINLAA